MLRDLATIGGLVYTCTRFDKGKKGCMNIHSVGPYFAQIKELLKFLPQIKHKYTGQRLPNISLKVLLLLIKQCRIREYLSGEKKGTVT